MTRLQLFGGCGVIMLWKVKCWILCQSCSISTRYKRHQRKPQIFSMFGSQVFGSEVNVRGPLYLWKYVEEFNIWVCACLLIFTFIPMGWSELQWSRSNCLGGQNCRRSFVVLKCWESVCFLSTVGGMERLACFFVPQQALSSGYVCVSVLTDSLLINILGSSSAHRKEENIIVDILVEAPMFVSRNTMKVPIVSRNTVKVPWSLVLAAHCRAVLAIAGFYNWI